MDSLLVVLRVVVSLVVVVALVWYLARRLGGRAGDTSREAEVRVLDRQSLSKHAGVAVVAAGDRRLLVGFADAGVQLITELRPVPALPQVPVAPPAPPASSAPRTAPRAPRRRPTPTSLVAPAGLPANRRPGLFAGSVLSPQTWHATVRAWQDRTVRR
ncbi:MAG TPA: flagellar biosynthetic protein FliO [Cellulomonas sp.]